MPGKKKPIQMNANYRKSELLLETGQIDVPGSGGEGKIYEGIAPIQVDNTNDQIGIDLTNIQAKLTAGQNITIDANNVISASGGEGHEYTGVAPIVVDNTNETVGVTMDAVPTAGSSNPVTSDGINQTINAESTALMQYVDGQVSGKADKNKFNTVAGYQVYTEGTPADIPVAIDANVVHKTGNEDISGSKVFISSATVFQRDGDFQRVAIKRLNVGSPANQELGRLSFVDDANARNASITGRYVSQRLKIRVDDLGNGGTSARSFMLEPTLPMIGAGLIIANTTGSGSITGSVLRGGITASIGSQPNRVKISNIRQTDSSKRIIQLQLLDRTSDNITAIYGTTDTEIILPNNLSQVIFSILIYDLEATI